jgi:hypothetical protein
MFITTISYYHNITQATATTLRPRLFLTVGLSEMEHLLLDFHAFPLGMMEEFDIALLVLPHPIPHPPI